jgi:hypothetical protein
MATESLIILLYFLSDKRKRSSWARIMRKWLWGGIVFVTGAIVQIVLDRIFDWSASILPMVSPASLSDILLIVGLIVGSSLIAVGIRKSRLVVKRIDDVQVFIFWPKGTLVEDKTLDFHRKHYHKKLIVNFKTHPPEAYYLIASKTSYGWKLIESYPDLYTSVEDITYPNPDTEKWCIKKGYHLNTYSASKEDLEKSSTTLP